MSHTAESVFQMAFEEIYSSDASTWHLQFHGNAILRACGLDVFLSNGVEAAPATPPRSIRSREHRGGLDGRGGRRARPHR